MMRTSGNRTVLVASAIALLSLPGLALAGPGPVWNDSPIWEDSGTVPCDTSDGLVASVLPANPDGVEDGLGDLAPILSMLVHEEVEPLLAEVDDLLGTDELLGLTLHDEVHTLNCRLVVPVEDLVEELLAVLEADSLKLADALDAETQRGLADLADALAAPAGELEQSPSDLTGTGVRLDSEQPSFAPAKLVDAPRRLLRPLFG